MSLFDDYLSEIEKRKKQGSKAEAVGDDALTTELIGHICRMRPAPPCGLSGPFWSITPCGTTSAAGVKAKFLKDIISGNIEVAEISAESAL